MDVSLESRVAFRGRRFSSGGESTTRDSVSFPFSFYFDEYTRVEERKSVPERGREREHCNYGVECDTFRNDFVFLLSSEYFDFGVRVV